jgi:pantoate--beta-alanine ligase
MRTLATIAEMRNFRAKSAGLVVLVPTMGALHAGHAALIDSARQKAGPHGTVIVSIFVNPTQFGPHEDFHRYPRPLDADCELCRTHGADAVFAPTVEEMYPPGDSTRIEENSLSLGLCGAVRPGHFTGVCTVVAKLFLITQPDAAIFGEKDYQQLAVIRRMVRDLFFPTEIIGHPTVRESDGLAMSSRNRYLSPEQRSRAALFATALQTAAQESALEMMAESAAELIKAATGSEPQYVSLVDAETLASPPAAGRPAVLAAAINIGDTRLIDNVRIAPRDAKV